MWYEAHFYEQAHNKAIICLCSMFLLVFGAVLIRDAKRNGKDLIVILLHLVVVPALCLILILLFC